MTNLTEKEQWEDGVYQIEKTDPVVGGPDHWTSAEQLIEALRPELLANISAAAVQPAA